MKKAMVPLARQEAVMRPISASTRTTLNASFPPFAAIFARERAPYPRRRPTTKKQRKPASNAALIETSAQRQATIAPINTSMASQKPNAATPRKHNFNHVDKKRHASAT